MCALLVPERLDGYYLYSVFKSLTIIDKHLLNMSILALKTGAPNNEISILLKTVLTIFIKFPYFMETISLNETEQVVPSGKQRHAH
jgi:hypothetical protein